MTATKSVKKSNWSSIHFDAEMNTRNSDWSKTSVLIILHDDYSEVLKTEVSKINILQKSTFVSIYYLDYYRHLTHSVLVVSNTLTPRQIAES